MVKERTMLNSVKGITSVKDAKSAKKLVFKSFKVQPKIPDDYEKEAWGKLKTAVESIYSSTRVPESLEELYKVRECGKVLDICSMQACENLCLQKKAAMTYTNLQVVCEAHVLRELARLQLNGDIVPRDTLVSVIRMLVDLNLYANDFEMAFLARTELYYLDEADRLVGDFPASDAWVAVARYIHHVNARINQESDRCNIGTGYLAQSTRKPLIAVLEKVLASRHMKTCLAKGRVIVIDPAQDLQMVQNLLNLKSSIDKVVATAFENDPDMVRTVKESFENFINQRPNKPAEMIAKHIDGLLRASKGITEEEVETTLDRCLILFRYINGMNRSQPILICEGKDVFEAFYKRDLAKRLLLGKSASVDSEKSMLLARAQQVFTDFYNSKYSGRVITWQNKLGVCVLKAHFKKGQKELSVSLFQGVVLLLFNNSARIPYSDIASQTNIEEKELERTLQSLACGKVRVLTKHPKGKDVKKTDVFEFNDNFENPLYRIKINSIQMKETPEEQKETTEKVFADRQYQVDAAIVRIMKSRKKLSHQLLITELFEQLKFPIKPQDLKKRIESLIDREYLERDENDSSTYNYVA
ncbi:Cullin-4B [Phlyctochytrium bullatum]|nr:Cullin-4B [Phlyctochytrium bullatum]